MVTHGCLEYSLQLYCWVVGVEKGEKARVAWYGGMELVGFVLGWRGLDRWSFLDCCLLLDLIIDCLTLNLVLFVPKAEGREGGTLGLAQGRRLSRLNRLELNKKERGVHLGIIASFCFDLNLHYHPDQLICLSVLLLLGSFPREPLYSHFRQSFPPREGRQDGQQPKVGQRRDQFERSPVGNDE